MFRGSRFGLHPSKDREKQRVGREQSKLNVSWPINWFCLPSRKSGSRQYDKEDSTVLRESWMPCSNSKRLWRLRAPLAVLSLDHALCGVLLSRDISDPSFRLSTEPSLHQAPSLSPGMNLGKQKKILVLEAQRL